MKNEGQIIRINSRRIVFPNICPVCCNEANSEGTVPAIPLGDRKLGKALTHTGPFVHDRFFMFSKGRPNYGSVSSFGIPTCDSHAISFDDTRRFRGQFGMLSGLLFVFAILMFVSFSLLLIQGILDGNLLILCIVSIFGCIISSRISGPSALERAVRIIDINEDIVVIWFQNSNYVEEILRINPMHATLLDPESIE